MNSQHSHPSNPIGLRLVARNFAIEVITYGVLLVGYFLLVLRFLSEPLTRLFEHNLTAYGFLALGLIAGQGVLLEVVTSLLIRLFRLERPD